MKKRVLILLLAAMLLSGCGGNTTNDTSTDTESTTPTENLTDKTAETETELHDDLPDDLDFDGTEIGICSSRSTAYTGNLDIAEYDENSSSLDQAIYNRNRNIEERLDVRISEFLASGAAEAEKTFVNTVTAGDNAYPILHQADRTVFSFGLKGYMLDLNRDMPYIDLTKPYWQQDGNAVLGLMGKQYGAFTELSLRPYDYTHLLVFNQDLIREYSLANPHDYWRNNDWTFDRFEELITAVHDDLDGNGKFDENDRYGYHDRAGFLYPLMYTAAGLKTVIEDKDGKPVFNMPGNEDFQTIYDWCTRVFYDEQAYYKQNAGNDFFIQSPMFQENKMLFSDMTFFNVGVMREMVSDFGIIVFPKYTAEQDRYYSWVEGGAGCVGVAVTCQNREAVGAALEALSCASMRDVIPIYYENNLKSKYSRDEISTQMFDEIQASRSFDLGDTIWCEQIRDYFGPVFFNQQPLASAIAKKQESFQKTLEDTIAALSD